MSGSGTSDFEIQQLGAGHDRKAFDCGVPSLTDYLRRTARQDMERDAAVAYVLVPTHNPTFIAGYYTLSAAQFLLRDLPEEQRRKLPRYPAVPGTLLGRLAVDNTVKGRRLGEQLLVDALHRSLRASRDVASVAVVVDALDEGAAAFYERYGFKRFRDTPLRLFLPMKDIEASFSPEA